MTWVFMDGNDSYIWKKKNRRIRQIEGITPDVLWLEHWAYKYLEESFIHNGGKSLKSKQIFNSEVIYWDCERFELILMWLSYQPFSKVKLPGALNRAVTWSELCVGRWHLCSASSEWADQLGSNCQVGEREKLETFIGWWLKKNRIHSKM